MYWKKSKGGAMKQKIISKTGLFLIGFICLFLVGGAFAYWTQELQVQNEFQTARYDTKIKEEFVPPNDWLPGQKINKDVSVQNKGTIPVFVRARVHQEWIRRENVYDGEGNLIPPLKGEQIPLLFETKDGQEYASQIIWGTDVVLLREGKQAEIGLGLPTVDTLHQAKGKWLLLTDVPDQEGNFSFYYIGNIPPQGESPKLVDAVVMNPKIEPEIKGQKTWYENNQKITEEIENPTYGYENAHYEMDIVSDTVQATKSAVKETFGDDPQAAWVLEYLAENETME